MQIWVGIANTIYSKVYKQSVEWTGTISEAKSIELLLLSATICYYKLSCANAEVLSFNWVTAVSWLLVDTKNKFVVWHCNALKWSKVRLERDWIWNTRDLSSDLNSTFLTWVVQLVLVTTESQRAELWQLSCSFQLLKVFVKLLKWWNLLVGRPMRDQSQVGTLFDLAGCSFDYAILWHADQQIGNLIWIFNERNLMKSCCVWRPNEPPRCNHTTHLL